jgi:hypothetical protein
VVEFGIQDGQQFSHRFRQMFKIIQVLKDGRLGAYKSRNEHASQPAKITLWGKGRTINSNADGLTKRMTV